MSNTTKTIQLTDTSNRNISPMVNLESLFYETSDNDKTVRHFIYQNFPIYLNFDNKEQTVYKAVAATTKDNVKSISIDASQTLVDASGNDIIISKIKQSRIPGTNYYRLDASNYNLSEILFNYETKSMADSSFGEYTEALDEKVSEIAGSIGSIITSINDINSSITTYNNIITVSNTSIISAQNEINDIFENKVYEYTALKQKRDSGELVPGKLYRMHYQPNTTNDDTLCAKDDNDFDLVLIADTSISFCEDVVSCLNHNGSSVNWGDGIKKWEVKYAMDPSFERFRWARPIHFYGKTLCIYKDDNTYRRCLGQFDSSINVRVDYDLDNYIGKDYHNIFITNLDDCGVIYYMKDERGNEAPYDFKNAKVWDYKRSNYYYTFSGNNLDYSTDLSVVNNVIKESPTLSIHYNLNTAGLRNTYVGYNNNDIIIATDQNATSAPLNIHVGNDNSSTYINNSYNIKLDNSNTSVNIVGNNNIIESGNTNINLSGNYNNIGVKNTSVSVSSNYNTIENNNTSINIIENNNADKNHIHSSCNNITITTAANIVGAGVSNKTIDNPSTFISEYNFVAKTYSVR